MARLTLTAWDGENQDRGALAGGPYFHRRRGAQLMVQQGTVAVFRALCPAPSTSLTPGYTPTARQAPRSPAQQPGLSLSVQMWSQPQLPALASLSLGEQGLPSPGNADIHPKTHFLQFWNWKTRQGVGPCGTGETMPSLQTGLAPCPQEALTGALIPPPLATLHPSPVPCCHGEFGGQ